MLYRVDAKQLHAMAGKMKDILDAPKPGNVKELHDFLHLVNCYGRFVPHLATVAHPLNHCSVKM